MQIAGAVLTDHGDGLAGVAVSDGRCWAFTGPDGSYSLETASTGPVWVRRPDGWAGQWWRHPEPGAPLVFRLHPGRLSNEPRSPRELLIAHLTDTHVSTMQGDPAQAVELAARYGDGTDTTRGLRRALSTAAAHGTAFAVLTGDLTDHGTPEEFSRAAGVIAAAPLPVELVPGNHDHYGHRHQPHPGDTPRGDGFLGSATVTRYEQHMGPRWWSADLGGVHILALDWFSAWCGIDIAEQQRFATADIATRSPGLPVVVLAHDQPDDHTLGLIRDGAGPGGLLAVLSGHWHAEAQRTVGGCHYLSTPAASFGGLDWSPAQLRIITVTTGRGPAELRHELVPAAPASAPPPGRGAAPVPAAIFSRSIGARQHLGTLACLDGGVIAPSADASGAGHLTRLRLDGDKNPGIEWTVCVAGEPISGILADDERVFACSLAGAVVALDAATGQTRWTYQLHGRHRRRILATPVLTPAGHLVVGDVGGIACLDVGTGKPAWHASDLGRADTLLSYGTGLATDHLAVLPLGGPTRGLTALHLHDGTIAWSDPPRTPPPSSSLVAIDQTDALLVRTAGPTIERLDLATGHTRWRTTLTGRYSTAAPLVTPDAILLVTGDGVAHHLDRDHGDILDRHQLPGAREAYGPYRSTGAGAPTAPVATRSGPVVVLLDGSIWRLDGPGGPELAGDVATTVTTQPVAPGRNALAIVSTDATLHLLDQDDNAATLAPADQESRQAS